MALWEQEYRKKQISAEKAAQMIRSGDRIMTGNRDARGVLRCLAKREDLRDVYYYSPVMNFFPDEPIVGTGLRPATSFMNDSSFALREQGRLDFLPGEYWQYDKLARKTLACNVAFIEVSLPDENGYFSMGTCADFVRAACKDAKLVIAETNSTFPFVYGNNLIHISEIDYVVQEGAENYLLLGDDVDTDPNNKATYQAIGGYLNELIEDEATLEVGLGRLNAASLLYLENKRDLGIHTEIFGDILMLLTEKGFVTNRKKTENMGVSVFTQVVGTEKLFRWLEKNPGVALTNSQDALNPGNIYRQHRLTAINNAVEIDLLGQANCEYVKGMQYSGVGGICNFASAAAACPDGKSILVLESTTRNGKFSKITPCFKPGTPAALNRTQIEYVVTEQGIASLAGKTPADRARALISVAHPKFREELTQQARELELF